MVQHYYSYLILFITITIVLLISNNFVIISIAAAFTINTNNNSNNNSNNIIIKKRNTFSFINPLLLKKTLSTKSTTATITITNLKMNQNDNDNNQQESEHDTTTTSTTLVTDDIQQLRQQQQQLQELVYFTSPLVEINSTTTETTIVSPTIPITTTKSTKYWTSLIILNTPIASPPSTLFTQLWLLSNYHVCADGGANRLYYSTTTVPTVVDSTSTSTSTTTTNDSDTATTSATTTGTCQNTQNTQQKQNQQYIPDLITGDLDSLHTIVREYYETNHNVVIIQDPDQDTNDLDKSVSAIIQQYNLLFVTDNTNTNTELPILRIIIYGAFGGRFDQEMASLQSLYKWSNTNTCTTGSTTTSTGSGTSTSTASSNTRVPIRQLLLYNDHTMAFLLQGGLQYKHIIQLSLPPLPPVSSSSLSVQPIEEGQQNNDITTSDTSVIINYEGPTCGIIPLGCPVDSLTTTGLQWNLYNHPTSFGQLVSTSNRIVYNNNNDNNSDDDTNTNGIVTIITSHPIIFTAEIITAIK